MSSWSGEEVHEGLEKWLKARRDEAGSANNPAWQTINNLLDEVRDDGAEGWLPWQKGDVMSEGPITAKTSPEFDVRKAQIGFDPGYPGFEVFVPPLNKVNCGPCMFAAESVDPESVERMFRDHSCEPHELGPEPQRWHESLAQAWHSLCVAATIVSFCYLVGVAFFDVPLPWAQ